MNNTDPRFADSIVSPDTLNGKVPDIVIIGVPTDEGIRRNGGRPGASHAPDAIRSYLAKLTPNDHPLAERTALDITILDAGNAHGETLEDIHENAGSMVHQYLKEETVIIALGGGHDVTYPLAKGMFGAISKPFSLINLDAHLDVRPKKDGKHHSGSSFRLLIEEGILDGNNFTEYGIQSFAYSKEHYDWVTDQGASVEFFDELYFDEEVISRFSDILASSELPYYVTFDIDSIRSSDAPGCSAPSPIGFTAEQALAMSFAAGQNNSTRVFDIVEVSPGYDNDGRTCRLAARMIANFIGGYLQR
ncbi:MAG TPA: formimidoylglutamase [Candidatus Kapabacteria bacterium]